MAKKSNPLRRRKEDDTASKNYLPKASAADVESAISVSLARKKKGGSGSEEVPLTKRGGTGSEETP